MILRLLQSLIATAREVGQKIAQALGAFSGKGTLSGVSPERTIALQSMVSIAHKGTFQAKGSIAARGAINFTPSNSPGTKGTFGVIRTVPGLGSVDIVSTNERWQVRVMVPALAQRGPFAPVTLVHRHTTAQCRSSLSTLRPEW